MSPRRTRARPNDASWWPDGTDIYQFDDAPTGRDMFLIGENELLRLRREWVRYLAPTRGSQRGRRKHPNNFLNYRLCTIESKRTRSCDVDICITTWRRFHGATRTLPKARMITCVRFWNWMKAPYLVVAQEWFDDIERELFTLYAMVDVIGMKQLLDKQGHVEKRQVASLRAGINRLARKWPDHAFLSCADNVFIKTNWSAGRKAYARTYRPEQFLQIILGVFRVFKSVLGLAAYAVVSQGSNALVDDALVRVSKEQNHIMFGSLGTPFAELFEVDRSVRQALRLGTHPPADMYLTRSFMLTLQVVSDEFSDRLRTKLFPFKSEVGPMDRRWYVPIGSDELFAHLTSKGKPERRRRSV